MADSALAGEWEIFRNAAAHLILPAAILGIFSMACIARMTRSFMLDQRGQESVLTARVKGVIASSIRGCDDRGVRLAAGRGPALAVMQHGEVVEALEVARLRAGTPANRYTRQLLRASRGYDRAVVEEFEA